MDEQQTGASSAPGSGSNPPTDNSNAMNTGTASSSGSTPVGNPSPEGSTPTESVVQPPVNNAPVAGQVMPETLAKPPQKKVFLVLVGGVVLLLALSVLVLAIL